MNVKFVKMYLNEREWKGVDWGGLTQDRDGLRTLANTVTNVQVPYHKDILFKSRETTGLSRGLYSMELVISMFHLHQMGEYKQICK